MQSHRSDHWAVEPFLCPLLVKGTLKSTPPDHRAPHILARPGGGGEVVEGVGRWWRWWGGGGGGGEVVEVVVGRWWRWWGKGGMEVTGGRRGIQGSRWGGHWELNLGPLDAGPHVLPLGWGGGPHWEFNLGPKCIKLLKNECFFDHLFFNPFFYLII